MNTELLKIMRRCAVITLAIGLGSLAARGDSFYNTQASWAAALSGGPTTVNFEGIAPPLGFTVPGFGPGTNIAVGGVNFAVGPAGTNNLFFVLGDGYYGYPVSTISLQPTDFTAPADLLITLPTSMTALGFDWGAVFTGGDATITLSDGTAVTVPPPTFPGFQFWGVTAPGGITSVEITLPDSYGLSMSDFSYGSAATATPEPGSLLLLGSGLVGLLGAVRRKIGFRT